MTTKAIALAILLKEHVIINFGEIASEELAPLSAIDAVILSTPLDLSEGLPDVLEFASRSKRKRNCNPDKSFPCGNSCQAQKNKDGSPRKCRKRLKGQAKTAAEWLEKYSKEIDMPTQQLESQIEALSDRIKELESENAKLREGGGFDEIGFWLLDRNFERSTFEDFGIDEEATETESKAKSEHLRLAKQYHPDNGGTAEQMANINRLKEQMLALVKMNGGMEI